MDSKSLTEYTNIVKNLVKSKKFLILIPNAGKLMNYFVFLHKIK